MTAKIGDAIGQSLCYEPISDEDARAQQIAWRAAPEMVEGRISIFRAIREGRLAAVTDTVGRVLGRKPMTFDQWVTQNAGAFKD